MIVYILVEKKNRKMVEDVKVRSGTEISSVHHLLVAHIKNKPDTNLNKTNPRKKIEHEIIGTYRSQTKIQ